MTQKVLPSMARLPVGVAVLGALLLAGCSEDSRDPVVQGSIEGAWSGAVTSNYFCEAGPQTLELAVSGTTVTITGGDAFTLQATGSLTRRSDEVYSVALQDGGGTLAGMVFFDTAKEHALLVIDEEATMRLAFVGVLQKGPPVEVTYAETDLVGSWSGVAARIDANYQVTGSSASAATFSGAAAVGLSGADGDGAFSAPVTSGDPTPVPGVVLAYDATVGLFVSGSNGANGVSWPEVSYKALYALSGDKKVLGVAFLVGLCEYGLTDDLPAQKFALWTRQ